MAIEGEVSNWKNMEKAMMLKVIICGNLYLR